MPSDSTTFERRKRLLALLHDQPGLRVPELARRLQVSQGTVRNDLNALADTGQLERVHGGGRLAEDSFPNNTGFARRFYVQQAAKRRIARWAADLIDDGDTIALDASTTAYRLASFIQNRHNLTVVTNGIETGRKLALNPSNTVMLLGGVLRPDGTPVTDLMSAQFLKDLHIKTAFMSCAGFTPEAGFTERDLREAQLKAAMLAAAGTVVALVDSTKFGVTNLTPFARTDQVARLFTDSDLPPTWIETVQKAGVMLTLCGETSVSDYAPYGQESRHYRIGFANLGESMPFSVDVRRSVERAARAAGNIDLVVADNQLSREAALKAAERFISQQLDLVIEYQIDEQAGHQLMNSFRQAGIPVIAVDIPIVGATYFGVDHYRAGHLAGVALGQWIKAHWQGKVDHLIVLEEPRAGAQPAARIQGQLDGLRSVAADGLPDKALTLNCGNTSEISETVMMDALKKLPGSACIAVICFNDDAAIGALTAARRLQREEHIVIVGQGADRRVRDELRHPESRIIGSTAYEPEKYGEKLIPLALSLLRGEAVPPAVYLDHTFVPAAPQRGEPPPGVVEVAGSLANQAERNAA